MSTRTSRRIGRQKLNDNDDNSISSNSKKDDEEMTCKIIVANILKLGEKQKLNELKELIKSTSLQLLIEAIKSQVHLTNGANFWTYLLRGFSLLDTQEFKDKRFQCVKAFLNELSSIELPYKLTYDLITRLCSDLSTFTNDQLIEIVEHSEDCLKIGDPKCVGWKDLLPETLLILTNQNEITVNCVKMTGYEYRMKVITNLCTMKWPVPVLTPIANMFVDLKLNNDEILTVLSKFSKYILKLAPLELPSLSFQLFSLCQNSSQIIIPIVGIEKYFYRYYYKKLFADMDSNVTDFDSIDEFSDKELREAEETIFHHLSFCTRFKISEQQMCITLRNLTSSSEIILTPFVLSAILSMTQTNREPDSWISSSFLLQFLKSCIKNNEDEKELSKYSVWCRDTLQNRHKDLEQIFTVLIDQNKDGKDVVTPGLVNLSFVLLRAKNSPKLNTLGINFLQKFIKKRFVFGQGVIKNLADWMIVEQDALQYSECLTNLGMVDTFTVSECVKTIKYVLDFFLWIPGNHAMRMMSFILPVIKISHTIRDYFIEMLQKAINSKDLATCRLGVYGFCMLLKQLNNNNSQRTAMTGCNIMTQHNISGFSLMSQSSLGNQTNPQRHFDMLTLEIIGCLRRCFTAQLEIKETLYESLNRAIELNPKLTPHILEFIDYHFRSYFEVDENECKINFDKIIKVTENNENDIQVNDNLGQLTMFIGYGVIISDKHVLNYDTSVLKTVIKTLIERICSKDLKLIEMTGSLDHQKSLLALQQLNLLEALMAYAIWTAKPANDMIHKIDELFKEHKRIKDGLKNMSLSIGKKGAKKSKKTNDTAIDTETVTINGVIAKKILIKSENIWDLPTIERFLRLLFDDVVSFANYTATAPLRSNRDLVRYVFETTAEHIEKLRHQPDYKQVKHSRRILKNLTEVTRVIYERCTKKLQNLWSNFDVTSSYLSVECLHQSLLTAQQVFNKKMDVFLKGIDLQYNASNSNDKIINILQNTFEKSIIDQDEFDTEIDGKKISGTLLQCLDILYEFIHYDDPITLESYKWLLKFCQNYEIQTKENSFVHKLLFSQRLKTHSGVFFNTIAIHLEKVFGQIKEEDELNRDFTLKSITEGTAESCLSHLLTTIRKQIEDIEFFINKSKSSVYKLKIAAEENQKSRITSLKTMERSICTQLVILSNELLNLTNVQIPLGICMDNFIRLLIQFYVCLTNFTKHIIIRHSTVPVSSQGIKFDLVLRIAGKPLASHIYALISYVEGKILGNNELKKVNPSADRAKILKDTKFLPKLILNIENFNKFVILLSKKTNEDLSHYLHIGTVRDFRIKTSALKEAIQETLTQSNQNEADEEMLEENIEINDENSSDDNLIIDRTGAGDNNSLSSSEDSQEILENESDKATGTQFMKNTAKVSAKIRKRKSAKYSEQNGKETPEIIEIIEDDIMLPRIKRTRHSKK